MNRTLMYSSVMFVTGTKSVVPGLLAFHWLKSNNPGRVVGSSARPSLSFTRARRNMSTKMSAWRSSDSPDSIESSPGSGTMPKMLSHHSPSSFDQNSSVPWLLHALGQVRLVHCTRVDMPRTGSRSASARPLSPAPAMTSSVSSSSVSGTGSYGLSYGITSEP